MTRSSKILEVVLRGASDANIAFDDLRLLLCALGFNERIKASHHIFTRKDVIEIINIQPRGAQAKAYQVRQIRNLILKYGMGAELND